jgi:nucleoside-diphosphate-sugar epimerase
MLGGEDLPSVRSDSPVVRAMLRPIRAVDTILGRMPERGPAPFLMRGTQLGLTRLRAGLTRYAPFSEWDLAMFGEQGRIDISKARTLLGYEPRLSLDEAMQATESWLRDQGVL